METNTNTNTNPWPMRIEMRTMDSIDAAEFGIDVNAEIGETVGWRVLPNRRIEVDSRDDARDVAGYIRREADLVPEDRSAAHRETVRAMYADADTIERAADRRGEE